MSGRAFDWSSFEPKDATTVDALRRRLVGNAPVVPIKGVTPPSPVEENATGGAS